MSTSWFDSRDLACKSPFGAVPCGTRVQFCLRPEAGAAITRCELLAHAEFADHWETLPLEAAQEDGAAVFRGAYTAPRQADLVWYHFRLFWADGGTSCYGKTGLCAWDAVEPWQLTVYDNTRQTPEWFGRGLTYQIFPDRFYRAKKREITGLVGPRTLHEQWDEQPEYRPNEQGEITCSDFFGGDLAGITEKLDYLSSLGVTTLYLCPIFEASTNHRYDTACYERIDPLLGTEEDFRTLCERARERGIRVLLDGVFNHTGRKSVYFNADGFYPTLGAAQGGTASTPSPTSTTHGGASGTCLPSTRRKKVMLTTSSRASIPSSAAGCARARPAGGWTLPTSCPTNSSRASAAPLRRNAPTVTSSARSGRTARRRSPTPSAASTCWAARRTA